MQSGLYTLIGGVGEMFTYIAAHPHGSVVIVLLFVCLFSYTMLIGLMWDEYTLGKTVNIVETQDALFMIVAGGTGIVISIASLIWYQFMVDGDLWRSFLDGMRY